MLRRIFCLSILISALAWGTTGTGATEAQSVQWTRLDVALTLLGSGQLVVVETHEVAFSGGPFTVGYRDIPLANIAGISSVSVAEVTDSGSTDYRAVGSFDEIPYTYAVDASPAEVVIRWAFPSTFERSRTFEIRYHVDGGVRSHLDESPPYQLIWWTAVSNEFTETAPVGSSTTTVTLPVPLDPSEVVAWTENLPIVPTTIDGQTWTWQAGELSIGADLTVLVQFPPLVSATPEAGNQKNEPSP